MEETEVKNCESFFQFASYEKFLFLTLCPSVVSDYLFGQAATLHRDLQ